MRLNRTQLKFIAVIAMLIDHAGMLFIPITTPLGLTCRIIGRLTAPIMFFFLSEGYFYTSSKRKYGERLLLFALISQLPYSLARYGTFFALDFNVIFTFFISFLILSALETVKKPLLKWGLIVSLIFVSSFCDWGVVAPLWVIFFHVYRGEKNSQALAFSLTVLAMAVLSVISCIERGYNWYGELWQLGLLMFLPLFYLYNGEKGANGTFGKWFFYIVYPLHLLVFGIIKHI